MLHSNSAILWLGGLVNTGVALLTTELGYRKTLPINVFLNEKKKLYNMPSQ